MTSAEPARPSLFRRGRPPALLALLAVALAARPAPQGGPPTAVRVDAARTESVQHRRFVTGDVRPLRRAEVASEEDGRLVALALLEGQAVEAGAVIARLDTERLELDVAVREAELEAARAVLAERESDEQRAQRDLAVLRELDQRSAANPKELADARTDAELAAARVKGAEADVAVLERRLDLLRDRLADMEIRAPFTGVVTRRFAELGEWLGQGDPVIELTTAGELEAWLDVPQSEWGAVTGAAAPIAVRVDATGEELELADYRAIPDVDARARTFSVVAALAGGAVVAPGMSLSAWVATGERRERLTIATDAILRNDAGAYVYVAAGGGESGPPTAMPVPVRIAFTTGGRAVVEPGRLAAGDLVVVEGNERLFPSMPLAPTPAEGGAAAGGAPAEQGQAAPRGAGEEPR